MNFLSCMSIVALADVCLSSLSGPSDSCVAHELIWCHIFTEWLPSIVHALCPNECQIWQTRPTYMERDLKQRTICFCASPVLLSLTCASAYHAGLFIDVYLSLLHMPFHSCWAHELILCHIFIWCHILMRCSMLRYVAAYACIYMLSSWAHFLPYTYMVPYIYALQYVAVCCGVCVCVCVCVCV